MKKRLSFAFILMCFVALLSLSDVVGLFSSVLLLFSNFTLISALQILCRIVVVLTPLAIVVLLYINRKNDIKATICLVLKICGYVTLIGVALKYRTWIDLFSSFSVIWPYNLMALISMLSSVVLGILLLCVDSSVKNNKTNLAVKVFASIGIVLWLEVFLLHNSVEGMASANLLTALKFFMMFLSLWFLPKTVCDYENCFLFGHKAIILMICVVVLVVVGRNIIARSNRGNCFNCDGSGWDSANNTSCVWCGGDGYSSWNP